MSSQRDFFKGRDREELFKALKDTDRIILEIPDL